MPSVCELTVEREEEDEGKERGYWNDPHGRGAKGEYKLKNVLFVNMRAEVLLHLNLTFWVMLLSWLVFLQSSLVLTTIWSKINCVAVEVWKTHPNWRYVSVCVCVCVCVCVLVVGGVGVVKPSSKNKKRKLNKSVSSETDQNKTGRFVWRKNQSPKCLTEKVPRPTTFGLNMNTLVAYSPGFTKG